MRTKKTERAKAERQLRILRALIERGPTWAADLREAAAVKTTSTVREDLYTLNYKGLVQWLAYPCQPAEITEAGRRFVGSKAC